MARITKQVCDAILAKNSDAAFDLFLFDGRRFKPGDNGMTLMMVSLFSKALSQKSSPETEDALINDYIDKINVVCKSAQINIQWADVLAAINESVYYKTSHLSRHLTLRFVEKLILKCETFNLNCKDKNGVTYPMATISSSTYSSDDLQYFIDFGVDIHDRSPKFGYLHNFILPSDPWCHEKLNVLIQAGVNINKSKPFQFWPHSMAGGSTQQFTSHKEFLLNQISIGDSNTFPFVDNAKQIIAAFDQFAASRNAIQAVRAQGAESLSKKGVRAKSL